VIIGTVGAMLKMRSVKKDKVSVACVAVTAYAHARLALKVSKLTNSAHELLNSSSRESAMTPAMKRDSK
jgi:hypothetical protein